MTKHQFQNFRFSKIDFTQNPSVRKFPKFSLLGLSTALQNFHQCSHCARAYRSVVHKMSTWKAFLSYKINQKREQWCRQAGGRISSDTSCCCHRDQQATFCNRGSAGIRFRKLLMADCWMLIGCGQNYANVTIKAA